MSAVGGLGRLVILAVISGLVIGVPPTGSSRDQQNVMVIKESNDRGAADEFNWSYELADGTQVQQKGSVKILPDGSKTLVIDGFYSYFGPDGVKYGVQYTADENGYHPKLMSGDVQIIKVQQVGIDPKVLASLVG